MPKNYINITDEAEKFRCEGFANNPDEYYLMLGKYVNVMSAQAGISIAVFLSNIRYFALQEQKKEEKDK